MSGENRKIAEWLGNLIDSKSCPKCCTPWSQIGDIDYHVNICKGLILWSQIPDFYNSNADAIKLLPELVERGYSPTLDWSGFYDEWLFYLNQTNYLDRHDGKAKTISAAICSAIIDLIEREEG